MLKQSSKSWWFDFPGPERTSCVSCRFLRHNWVPFLPLPLTLFEFLFCFVSKNIFLFIWLCWVLVVPCRIFSCGMWDLVPLPGIKHGALSPPTPPHTGSAESQPLDHQGSLPPLPLGWLRILFKKISNCGHSSSDPCDSLMWSWFSLLFHRFVVALQWLGQ